MACEVTVSVIKIKFMKRFSSLNLTYIIQVSSILPTNTNDSCPLLLFVPLGMNARRSTEHPDLTPRAQLLHQSTAASTWWCRPRPSWGWVEMAAGLPEGPSYPVHSPHAIIFLPFSPLSDRKRQHSVSLKLFACLFCFFLGGILILLLLMSSNIYSNPDPVFPCSE